MPPRGAASRGGKTTAWDMPGGRRPRAHSPATEATTQDAMGKTTRTHPPAEGRSRNNSDKKQKSQDESCHPEQGDAESRKQSSPAGRKSSAGSGSGGSDHRGMGGGGASGSGRRSVDQVKPKANGLHIIVAIDVGQNGTAYAVVSKGPDGSFCLILLATPAATGSPSPAQPKKQAVQTYRSTHAHSNKRTQMHAHTPTYTNVRMQTYKASVHLSFSLSRFLALYLRLCV